MRTLSFTVFVIVWLVQTLKGLKREDVQLATKFGIQFKGGFENTEVRGDPEYVRACCEASLKRLDVDYIDLYYVHRIDIRVPIEITVSSSFDFYISLLFWQYQLCSSFLLDVFEVVIIR